jgi:hypothetical protein
VRLGREMQDLCAHNAALQAEDLQVVQWEDRLMRNGRHQHRRAQTEMLKPLQRRSKGLYGM